MPYPLNNVETDDGYDDFTATLELHPPRRVATVTVSNAAVFAQFDRIPSGMRAGAGTLEPEEYWLPGVTMVDRDYEFSRIRFRSAVAGEPARISARG